MPRKNRRQELSTVALKLFAQRGYSAATLHDIAKEVGMTEPAVYRHFDNKEDMALSFFNEYLLVMDEIMSAVEEQTSFKDQVQTLVDKLMGLAHSRLELFKFCVLRNPEFIQKIVPDSNDSKHPLVRLKKIVTQAQKKGEAREANPNLLTGEIFMGVAKVISMQENGLEVSFKDMETQNYLVESALRVANPN